MLENQLALHQIQASSISPTLRVRLTDLPTHFNPTIKLNISNWTHRASVATTMSCIFLPQNGDVDATRRYVSADSSATKDSHNGNLGSNENPKRPKNLGMNGNGYVTKNSRETNGVDSSLPSTPSSDSGLDVSASAGDEALDTGTRHLISGTLADLSGNSKTRWNESREQTTMKRVVKDVLEKHRYAYNGMINKLSLDTWGDDASFVGEVAKSLFADGTTNWGRIASLVAFGAVVCQYLKEQGRENCVELVGQEISTYLLCEQRDWLVKNNAWDGFVEFFRVADPESTVRKTLMAFAGFAGIGATLALLIRRTPFST